MTSWIGRSSLLKWCEFKPEILSDNVMKNWKLLIFTISLAFFSLIAIANNVSNKYVNIIKLLNTKHKHDNILELITNHVEMKWHAKIVRAFVISAVLDGIYSTEAVWYCYRLAEKLFSDEK